MLIGRREDFIAKMQRAAGAWLRQDAMLNISARSSSSLLQAVLEVESDAPYSFHFNDADADLLYDDEMLVSCYDLICARDLNLRRRVLAHFEANDPRAKKTATLQLSLF